MARLWKIGIRASLRDVVTVGGALQHLLAETRSGRTAFVIGTDALRRHVAEAGLKVLNGTDLASRAEVVVVGGTEELVYDDLRVAVAGGPPRRRLPRHRARPHLPAARRPLARHRRDPRRGRGGERAHRARSWASRSRSCS